MLLDEEGVMSEVRQHWDVGKICDVGVIWDAGEIWRWVKLGCERDLGVGETWDVGGIWKRGDLDGGKTWKIREKNAPKATCMPDGENKRIELRLVAMWARMGCRDRQVGRPLAGG